MNHITSIGLDVHARSISAAAFNPMTGEVVHKRFCYEPAELASWILSFDKPKAIYESGVTGFHLCRELKAMGVDCVVGAASKMHKPAADKKRKNDRVDAEFLARLLSMHNVVEVFVPDEECEAARDLVRAYADVVKDLTRARQRLSFFLMRHGYTFSATNNSGASASTWSKTHWAWIREIQMNELDDEDVFALYISEVRHLEDQKKQMENFIKGCALKPRWKSRVDALRCLKGIETVTAFSLVVETCVFARFDTAREFESWTGLVPSEHSSGEKISHGGITKTGNSLVRHLLIEAAWHYPRASEGRKKAPNQEVPLDIQDHAAKATKRLVKRRRALSKAGKKPVVANCATARELAGWVWAIGCMCESSRSL